MTTTKTFCFVIALAAICAFRSQAQVSPPTNPGAETRDYSVAERGAHHRVWKRVEYETAPDGRQVPKVHSYTELETGMHYVGEDGQFHETQEVIESHPGGAVARQGPHKVIFANNLNTYGAIDLETPDGKRLQSHVLGLWYFDSASSQSVLIAEVQDCQGQIVNANQVLYPDAFNGLRASVRLTYTKAGLEQDVILEARPPPPETFGMDPATTRLILMTEFVSPVQPIIETAATGARSGAIPDQRLDFGEMKMGPGKAFTVGEDEPAQQRFSVSKEWTVIDGRSILIEQVSVAEVARELEKISASKPRTAMNSSGGSKLHVVSAKRLLPQPKRAPQDKREMKLAKLENPVRGFLLDYSILSGATNFTFKGDTTYFVANTVNLYGTTTIEGGAVIKYTNYATGFGVQNAEVVCNGPLQCQTAPYRPAIFTAKDDNSVGEPITGSSGSPSGRYGGNAIFCNDVGTPLELRHLQIRYIFNGITIAFGTHEVRDVKFVRVATAFYLGAASVAARNVLIQEAGCVFSGEAGANLYGENLTVNQAGYLYCYSDGGILTLTNSLLVLVTNWGNAFTSVNNATNETGAGVFQTAGAGSHYLATTSPYRNVGTTNISPSLLAELRKKTTYPPIVYSNQTLSAAMTFSPQAQRDTDFPDLGYHYDPLDYAFGGVIANSNLTFTAGTVAAWFELPGSGGPGYGIRLADTRTATFNGTVTEPCTWVRYSTVQEGGNGLWKDKGWLGGITTDGNSSHSGAITATFTRFAGLASDPNHVRDYNALLTMRANHCEFWSAHLSGYAWKQFLTNCLMDRVGYVGAQGGGTVGHVGWRNCTMRGGIVLGQRWSGSTWPVWIENCAFDATALDMNDTSGGSTNITYCDYNGFLNGAARLVITGAHDLVVSTFAWQTNVLGNFYQPTNSPLINTGSVTADLVGLYHFTTQTNQAKETTSQVDIGYHFVAVNLQDEFEIPKSQMTASASSTGFGWLPAYAIDGSLTDPGWHNATQGEDPAWLRIDLAAVFNLKRAAYRPRQYANNGTYLNFAIYATTSSSTNPGDWGVSVASGTWSWPSGEETKTEYLTNAVGRYLFFRRNTSIGDWASANEIWAWASGGLAGRPVDSDGDGLPDYFEDTNGNGSYGSAADLSNWQSADTDGDGVSDYLEFTQGRNPQAAGATPDGGVVSLRVYTPLR